MIKSFSFSEDEYRRRVVALQLLIQEQNLDTLVITDLANICYLSGFQTIGSYGYALYALVVPAEGDVILFASDFESHNAKIGSWIDDVVVYRVQYQITGNPFIQLIELLKDRRLCTGRIGCEQGHFGITVREFHMLTQHLENALLVDAGDLVDRVKIVKSSEEIEILRRAARLTTIGAKAGIESALEGNSDNDIAAAVYKAVIRHGGEYFSLQPVVTTGSRSGIPHSTFKRNQLKKGDNIFMEISASYERYSAPTLRTMFIGKPSFEVSRALAACKASVTTLTENLKHGVSAKAVAQKAGKSLRKIEPALIWHGYYGYSVGLTFPPAGSDCKSTYDITEAEDFELKSGMVFHCNTSLRKIGVFGVTMGDTVLITDSGCEILTGVTGEMLLC